MIIISQAAAPVTDRKPALQRVGRRPRLRIWWESWAGEVWEISNTSAALFALQGAAGFGLPDVDHQVSESALLDGATWGGVTTAAQEPMIPLRVEGPTTTEFLALHDAVMRALEPTRESWVTVERPDGQSRRSAFRYKAGGDAPLELDPVEVRRATYGITWLRTDPLWQGEPVEVSFSADVVARRSPPSPPHFLRNSRSLARSTMTNPGDVGTHTVVRVEGPFSGFTIGIGDAVTTATMTKAAGQWVEIDMRPRANITDNTGTDRGSAAMIVDMAPELPPGDTELVTVVEDAATLRPSVDGVVHAAVSAGVVTTERVAVAVWEQAGAEWVKVLILPQRGDVEIQPTDNQPGPWSLTLPWNGQARKVEKHHVLTFDFRGYRMTGVIEEMTTRVTDTGEIVLALSGVDALALRCRSTAGRTRRRL